MSVGPWFKCYPDAFIGGLFGLDTDEQAFYVQLVLRMYDAGDAIYADDRQIARWCSSNARKWGRVKASLVAKGKLFELSDGGLINPRALKEMTEDTSRLPERVRERLAKLSQMFGQCLAKDTPNIRETSPEKPIETRPLIEARSEKLEGGVVLGVREIQSRCLQAAGLTEADAMMQMGLVSPIEIVRLIQDATNPCDLDLDVIPAIQACAASKAKRGETLTHWSYCREAILRNRDKRLAGNPSPTQPPAGRGGPTAAAGKHADSSRAAAGIRLAAEISAARRPDDSDIGEADPWSRDGLDAMWAGRGLADGAGSGRGHLAVAFDNGSPVGENGEGRRPADDEAGDGCIRPQATRVAG